MDNAWYNSEILLEIIIAVVGLITFIIKHFFDKNQKKKAVNKAVANISLRAVASERELNKLQERYDLISEKYDIANQELIVRSRKIKRLEMNVQTGIDAYNSLMEEARIQGIKFNEEHNKP